MKIKNRQRAAGLFFGLFLIVGAVVGTVSSAQDAEGLVTEGESLNGIVIGKSTMSDVIANYGMNYKLIDHNGYSYEMIYKDLGLSFYYCQADRDKEIFVIEMEAPAKIRTSRGIVLGKSTFADVLALYGEWEETSAGFEYEKEGIYFDYKEDTDGEDDEDARNEPRPKSSPENSGFTIDGASGSESEAVKDENNLLRVSGGRTNAIDYSENAEAERASTFTLIKDEPRDEQKKLEATKKKTVKLIELIEKGGLRQCGYKSSKK